MRILSYKFGLLLLICMSLVTTVLFYGATAATASPLNLYQPQQPNATVNSYGSAPATGYMYGPLHESSSTQAVSVTDSPYNPGALQSYDGAMAAHGGAHATPGGDIGAYAQTIAPDGTSNHPYTFDYYYPSNNTTPVVDSNASFANSATVTSEIDPSTNLPYLAAGTPVQIAVKVRMDGTMSLGAGDYSKAFVSPGGFTTSSDVSGSFHITDPTITGTGEDAGNPVNLVSFQADAYGNNAGYYDYAKNAYAVDQSASYASWSLTSNHGDNLSGSDFPDLLPLGTSISAYALNKGFDTGVQTVILDTAIGHVLNWNGSLDVFNQSYGQTASTLTDFSHTFAANLAPVTSNVALNFSYPQQNLPSQGSTVPEPSSMVLLGLGLLMVGLFRRNQGSSHFC